MKNEELIYQVKIMLGTCVLLFDLMPEMVQYHISRVAANLSSALLDVVEEDVTVGDSVNLAIADVLSTWQKDTALPENLRNLASEQLNKMADVNPIWDIWNETDDSNPTD